MKFIKKIGKSIIICIVIFVIFFSNISYGYTPEEVGNAVAGFARHVVDDYGDHVGYRQLVGDVYDHAGKGGVPGHSRMDNPIWSPTSYTWDSEWIYFDCSSFATGCYKYVTGLVEQPWATGSLIGSPPDLSANFEKITWDKQLSSLKNGDLLFYHIGSTSGHAWIYSGDGQTSENGSKHNEWNIYNSKDIRIWRITEKGANSITNLNTEFSLAGTGSSEKSGLDYSEFYFSGIPDGKYSVATTNIFEVLVDTFKNLVDYLIGMITYIIRVVFVGFTAIADNLLSSTIKAITDTNVDTSDIDLNKIEVRGVEEEERELTIESIVFNEFKLFDVNIFDIK